MTAIHKEYEDNLKDAANSTISNVTDRDMFFNEMNLLRTGFGLIGVLLLIVSCVCYYVDSTRRENEDYYS